MENQGAWLRELALEISQRPSLTEGARRHIQEHPAEGYLAIVAVRGKTTVYDVVCSGNNAAEVAAKVRKLGRTFDLIWSFASFFDD